MELKYQHIDYGNDGNTYEVYDYGLKLLVEERYGLTSTYCSSLECLLVNESHVKLATIEDCIKQVIGVATSSHWYSRALCGFYTDSASVLSSLSDCSQLTAIYADCFNLAGATVDLRNNLSLSTFYIWSSQISCTVYLPSSCTRVVVAKLGDSGVLDLSRLSSFSLLTELTTRSNLLRLFNTVSEDALITTWRFIVNFALDSDAKDFDILYEIYESNGYKLNIGTLYASSSNASIVMSNLTSLSGIEYIDGLTTINFPYEYFLNLKDTDCLLSHSSTLTKIVIKGSAISDLSNFSSLTSLQYLDLSNSAISNYTIDGDGNYVYNLKILAGLNGLKSGATGSLTQLYLNNCPSVTDWSDLTSLSWTTFSYSN